MKNSMAASDVLHHDADVVHTHDGHDVSVASNDRVERPATMTHRGQTLMPSKPANAGVQRRVEPKARPVRWTAWLDGTLSWRWVSDLLECLSLSSVASHP